jgi:hypothetical protein
MNKIEPEYVTFEQAKWLKEKGFNLPTTHYYFEDGEFKEHSLKGTNGYYGEEYEFNLSDFNENWNDKFLTKKSGDRCFGCSKDTEYFKTYSAPEQWQVVEWLRVNHGIWVYTKPVLDEDGEWIFKSYIKLMNDFKAKEYQTKLCREPQEAYNAAFDYIKNEELCKY